MKHRLGPSRCSDSMKTEARLIHTGRVPLRMPAVRQGSFKSYLSIDVALNSVGWENRWPGETSIQTGRCLFEGKRYHFIVWFPASLQWYALLAVLGLPAALSASAFLAATLVGASLVVSLVLSIVVVVVTLRRIRSSMAKRMRVWQGCTGFVALDLRQKPIRDPTPYPALFQAYATMEEAYFRPPLIVHGQNGVRGLQVLLKSMRIAEQVGSGSPESTDRGSKALTKREKDRSIVDLLARIAAADAHLHNLLLKIGEDGTIRRAELLRRIAKSSDLRSQLVAAIHQRGSTMLYPWVRRRLERRTRRDLQALHSFEKRISPRWNPNLLRIPSP